MLKFIQKAETFQFLDAGLHNELGWSQVGIHLKTWQDMAVYFRLKEMRGKSIAEIGGGASRVLKKIKEENTCFNIDKFEGADGGPKEEFHIAGVQNIKTFMGEFSDEMAEGQFDVVYSVSVVEHVPNEAMEAFMLDTLRVLKPGGLCLHAIDLYVESEPIPRAQERLDLYRSCLDDHRLVPIEPVLESKAAFRTDFVSNPDFTMWTWGKVAPALKPLREVAQSTSLLMGFHKMG